MKGLAVVVLAAGLGTRMKSSLAKVLHPLAGSPMLSHVLLSVTRLRPDKVVVVVGHQADKVRALLPDGAQTADQKEQLGTAHAALTGLKRLGRYDGTLLLVSGDTPLMTAETLRRLLDAHKKSGAQVSILTASPAEPKGYGRIIRDGSGAVKGIVEEKDASPAEKSIGEINTGTYCFDAKALGKALKSVRAENAQKEFYLTDVAAIAREGGGKVLGVPTDDPEEALGINSRADLARAERTLRNRINTRHMLSGVTIIDPETTYIGTGAVIGADTVIYPGNHINGDTVIGRGVALHPGNVITDSTVKDGAEIRGYSVLTNACVDEGAAVGPFAHLRPGSRLGRGARVGNFVELKKALIGEGAKASHLSYLGDAVIGKNVNVGAGTITCNYDGFEKFQTVIEDDVFVGSDTQLVAPVRVGRGAVIAAGTTLTKDVPADALALSRVPQTVREGWAAEQRKRKAKAKA